MKEIRDIIQKVISETVEGNKNTYGTSTRNAFPYMDDAEEIRLPEDINPQRDEYMYDQSLKEANGAVEEFPMSEFHKGLQVERNRNEIFSIFEVAEVVISRLKDNQNFYSEILQPKMG